MYKYLIVVALLAGSASCQESSAEGAPEPYAYAYETDSHAASEQRDPSGTVTGFYTLADADGRQRRVEYVADKDGFRAKVQTNEVGTKSENSADVEVLASPPNAEQLVYQTATVQAAQAPVAPVSSVSTVSQVAPVATVAQQQRYVTVQQQAPLRTVSNVQYVQQPGYAYNYGNNYGYNYYPGYTGYNGYTGYTGQRYGYGAVQGVANGVVGGVYNTATVPVAATTGSSQYGVNTYGVGNYNYHTPSSYYARYSTSAVQPASYGVVGASRYVSSNVVAAPAVTRTSSYSVVPGSVGYGAPVASVSAPVSAGVGSSNYLVLKKRETQK